MISGGHRKANGAGQQFEDVIHSTFREVTCCLMPHPGETTSLNARMKAIFTKNVRAFIEAMVSPQLLHGRMVGKGTVNVHQFYHHLQDVIRMVSSDEKVLPRSLIEAVEYATNRDTRDRTVDLYRSQFRRMQTNPTAFVPWPQLSKMHRSSCDSALAYLSKSSPLGGKRQGEALRTAVLRDIETVYSDLRRNNERAERLEEFRQRLTQEAETALQMADSRRENIRINEILLRQMEKRSDELQKRADHLENEVRMSRKRSNPFGEEQPSRMGCSLS